MSRVSRITERAATLGLYHDDRRTEDGKTLHRFSKKAETWDPCWSGRPSGAGFDQMQDHGRAVTIEGTREAEAFLSGVEFMAHPAVPKVETKPCRYCRVPFAPDAPEWAEKCPNHWARGEAHKP